MLHDVVNDHWVHVHTNHGASHVDHEKVLNGALFLCMHVVLFLFLWSSGLLGSGCWSSAIKGAV